MLLMLSNVLLPGFGLVWRGRMWAGLTAVALIAVVVVLTALGWALTVAGSRRAQSSGRLPPLVGWSQLSGLALPGGCERGDDNDPQCAMTVHALLGGNFAVKASERSTRSSCRAGGAAFGRGLGIACGGGGGRGPALAAAITATGGVAEPSGSARAQCVIDLVSEGLSPAAPVTFSRTRRVA